MAVRRSNRIEDERNTRARGTGLRYMALCVALAAAVIMSVQFFGVFNEQTGDNNEAFAVGADHTIDLTAPGSGPGWANSGTDLTFDQDANGLTYEITQIFHTALPMVIIFMVTVETTVTFNGINISGNVFIDADAVVKFLILGENNISGSIITHSDAEIIIDSATGNDVNDELNVTATGNHAGIGGMGSGTGNPGDGRDAGKITILGGTVTATGVSGSAGIGGGAGYLGTGGNGGTIRIEGGFVHAKGSNQYGGAGIGGAAGVAGTSGNGGNITITGGTVYAIGGDAGGAGIGGGNGITAGGGDGGTITITGGRTYATGSPPSGGAGIGGGGGSSKGGDGGTITISGDAFVEGIGGNNGGAGIGGGLGGNGRSGNITIEGNAQVHAISFLAAGIGGGNSAGYDAITIGGNAEVRAESNGIVGGAGVGAGGGPATNGTIVIKENAEVRAQSNSTGGAGIGGGNDSGSITISDDTKVYTTVTNGGGAGIGGGYNGTVTSITIKDRAYVITAGGAASTTGGAGIGGGAGTNAGSGGNITISDDVYIESTGGGGGAGIGGGAGTSSNGAGGNITISGGTIIATGSVNGAGIGGGGLAVEGTGGAGGNITISGGTVTATGAGNGAGIGGGGGGTGISLDGAAGVIKFENDATVYAYSGAGNAAGIGRGGGNNSSSTAATLTIDVTAVVFAYSTGTGKAAIDAVSTTSTSGYFVNAKIVAPEFPASADVDVYVFPDGLTDPTDLFCILTVPAGYCNFAYTTNAVSTQDDNLYALMDIIDIRQIVQNTVTEEREIPSRNDDVQLPVKFGISFTITVNVTMAGTGDPVEDAEIEFKVGDYPFTILTDPSGDCSMTLPEGLAFTFISVTKDSAHAKEAMPPAFVIDADDDFFFTMNVMYDVDVIGSNITSWTPTDTYHGQDDLEVTITADTGYHVSGITSVTMDGATLTEGSDYTVTDNVVTFLIDVEGDIVITAAAEPDEYDVDVIGSSVSSWTPDVAYHDQNDLVVTITPNTGYQIAGVSSVTMGSATLTEGTDFTVSDNVVTFLVDVDGDIVITVTTAPNDYIVDVIGSNVASWTPTGTYHGESGLTVTITMDAGYGIGAIPSVTMNTSPLTEGIGYTVSGNVVTFIDNVNGNVLIVVVAEPFEYTIDVIGSNVASWTPTDTYHGESDLIVTITADAGYRISGITSVTMDGAALTEGTDYTVADNVVTFLVSVNGDIVITAATEPSTYEVTVKVISDVGGSFEYTVTMGGTVIGEDGFTLGPGETYTIMDIPYGASVLITAIPDDGHKVVWNDNTPMRSEGLIFARGSITENINDLTVKFIPPSDDDVPVWSLLIVAFIGLIFLLIFLDDDEEEVYGKVTYNGKGLFAVKIGYTLNGGGRKEVMTDKDGDYSITVDKGDTVVITDVSKSRSSVSEGLPAEILIEKDRTKVDFKF